MVFEFMGHTGIRENYWGKGCAVLTIFCGRAGDRNARAMAGAQALGKALAAATGLEPQQFGMPEPPLAAGWEFELDAARPALKELGRTLAAAIGAGQRPLTVMGRCAAGLGTLPVIAKRWPDAAIVWFDAHGDCNTPEGTTTGYLGGMVLSGAAGRWKTGLGGGLDLSRVVLVGARDLDPAERAMIDQGKILLVRPTDDLPTRLDAALAGRPAYVHLDCDVLNPGIVATEFQVPGGLSLGELRNACAVLAKSGIVGIEIAEFEGSWADGKSVDPAPLIAALEPLLAALKPTA
ncbi:MAG: arginase family protein [Rhizomicrobium sp.]